MEEIGNLIADSIIANNVPFEAQGQVFIRLVGAVRKKGWATPSEVDEEFIKRRVRLETKNYRCNEKKSRLRQGSDEG